MNNEKNNLRKQAKLLRKSIDTVFCSERISEHILSWDVFDKAENIMLFYPMKLECSLLNLLNNESKSFFFPTVDGNHIYPVKYDKSKGFLTGKYGIKEPVGDKMLHYEKLDLMFLPSLAVDINGYRLGYGKGYYDRFLEHFDYRCTKAAVQYSDMVFKNIPFEPHDKRVDFIITENGVIKSNSLISGY